MKSKYVSFSNREIKMIEDFRKRNNISSFSASVRMMFHHPTDPEVVGLIEGVTNDDIIKMKNELLEAIENNNKLIKSLKNHIAPFSPDCAVPPDEDEPC
jgi:type III secretion system FlhB-like substrate exporter